MNGSLHPQIQPIGISTAFFTESLESTIRDKLQASELPVQAFRADGEGGKNLEKSILERKLTGVLDLITTELANEFLAGDHSASRDRLTAAAIRGLPQVISLGGLDHFTFKNHSGLLPQYANRAFWKRDNDEVLIRTSPEENDLLGRIISERACASRGSTAIIIPLRGLSSLDREGEPFWSPDANHALFQSLRNWLAPMVKLIELDCHLLDSEFTDVAIKALLKMLPEKQRS